MLGVEREASARETVGDAGVDGLQPLDRGKETQSAAPRRLDQPRIGAGETGYVAALEVSDDQHFAVGGIVERAVGAEMVGGMIEVAGPGPCLRRVPAFGIAQGRRRDDRSEEHTSELQSLMRIS